MSGMFSVDPWDEFDDAKVPKTCKFCGEDELYWTLINDSWLLVDEDGELHNCRKEDANLENDLIENLKRRIENG